MTEAQADILIGLTQDMLLALDACITLLEVIAVTTGVGAGMTLAILFVRALVQRSAIT